MIAKPTRTLVDIAAMVAIAWMWVAVYESFTRSGLWLVVDGLLGGVRTMPGEAAVLALAVLVGWLSLAIACWSTWRLFLRDRLDGDFPAARLHR